jgi:hypothetical protein
MCPNCIVEFQQWFIQNDLDIGFVEKLDLEVRGLALGILCVCRLKLYPWVLGVCEVGARLLGLN